MNGAEGSSPTIISGQPSATTWGDIFWIWVFKGADPGYAAHMADQWEKRRENGHARGKTA